jgi:cytochrome c biogenesis protein CcdA
MEWVLLGIAATAALIGSGFAVGYILSGPAATGSISGESPKTCDDFCKAWQVTRVDVCSAIMALANAQSIADNLAKTAGALAIAAAAAAGAAIALGWVPFLGPTLVSASITAAATATVAAGLAAGAAFAAVARGNELTSARTAETAAKLKVFENCKGDALASCLAMPAPC